MEDEEEGSDFATVVVEEDEEDADNEERELVLVVGTLTVTRGGCAAAGFRVEVFTVVETVDVLLGLVPVVVVDVDAEV